MTPALSSIRSLDYTIIYVRDLAAMRRFYGDVMGFRLVRELGGAWFEYQVGANVLALALPHITRDDPPVPKGAAALQLAFRVAPRAVDACAAELAAAGALIVSPPADQPWGHRTLFFRDPDGNLLEIYADI
jgi:lactoylglutathione lyase